MAIVPIELTQLDTAQFRGIQQDGTLTIQLKISPEQDNKLQITSQGIAVLPTFEQPQQFVLNHNNNAMSVNAGNIDLRKTLYVQPNGFGYMHLDFTAKVATHMSAYTLPDNAPRPTGLLEVQTWDGGTIWIGAGDNVVKFNGLNANRRYIVDIVGFWRTT